MSKNHRKKCITCDIKRNSKKQIRASLVKLARELSPYYVKLKKSVTRRKCNRFSFSCHLINKLRIPCGDYNMSPLRRFFYFFNRPFNLVNFSPVRGRPSPPLNSVNRPKLSKFFRKFLIIFYFLNIFFFQKYFFIIFNL